MLRPCYTNASMDVHYKNQDFYVNLKRCFDSACGWYLQLLFRQCGECHLSRGCMPHAPVIPTAC